MLFRSQRQQLDLLQKHLEATKDLNDRLRGMLQKPDKPSAATARR